MAARVAAVIGAVGLVLAFTASARTSQSPPNSVQAPVQVVHVSWGSIGYRVVGKGRPLVLLVGAPASIDVWMPALLDDLARGAQVYAMDYAGIGRTTLHPFLLNIPHLADDTATFIRALHLGRVDVMGWSFGGFVAQALAVRHPTLVRRMVLAATALGDGKEEGQIGIPPAHLKCSDQYSPMFPDTVSGCGAAIAYDHAIHAYPDFGKEEPAAVAEGPAMSEWVDGLVREGHMAAKITVPVLIGDGTRDVVIPAVNSVRAAKVIPHATLKLYPDAGHGFLFQDEANWSALVLHFLNTR